MCCNRLPLSLTRLQIRYNSTNYAAAINKNVGTYINTDQSGQKLHSMMSNT